MLKSRPDFDTISKTELRDLYEKLLHEKHQLELDRIYADRQIFKSKKRTLDLFGKMIDLKKAQKIITNQKIELEAKNIQINRQKMAVEHTFQKFRLRTIDLFGKMIDLKKANKTIRQQKDEIDIQRKLLDETNKSKDKFFSILAHDLKSPIGGFLGLTRIMADSTKELPAEKQKYFAEMLHESSKQLYSLLENLLNWARSQTGSVQYNPQAIDLNKLVESTISQASINAQLKKITIRKKEDDFLQIYADEDTLNAILRNLLSNAIKYSYPDSFIDISVTSNDKMATISITDYGLGIEEEELDKLFSIAHTPSRLGTAKEKGTGLGLILCKEFIELNRGRINVKSVVGKGSAFSITVPLLDKTQ